MGVHFDEKNLECIEKALKRLRDRNHGSYDNKEIDRALRKIRSYRETFGVK